jgi:hypothetical protein
MLNQVYPLDPVDIIFKDVLMGIEQYYYFLPIPPLYAFKDIDS